MKAFDTDPEIGCIVITGNEKAFAAGVDIKEMHTKSFVEAYGSDFLAPFDKINNIRKPIIAAVGGSWIVKKELVDSGDWAGITDRAKEARQILEHSTD